MRRQQRLKSQTDAIADVIGGMVLTAVGLLFVAGTWQFGVLRDGGRLDAGAMPVLTGSLLAFCGVSIALLGARSLMGARTATIAAAAHFVEPGVDRAGDAMDNNDYLAGTGTIAKAMLVLALSAGAVWLAPRIGFLLAFSVLLYVLWVWLEGVRPLKALILTGGVILFTHLLFVQFLRIPLPRTPFL